MSRTLEIHAHEDDGLITADARSSSPSAVSWGAIFAGAAATAALLLILLLLGTGLGLGAISPWAHHGIDVSSFGVATIVWLAFTQTVAYGMGGYLAGRLRTKWIAVHTDEVFFRDTAHGFLAWAVASLVSAVLLTSAIGALVGGHGGGKHELTSSMRSHAGRSANGAQGMHGEQSQRQVSRYFIDALLRPPLDAPGASSAAQSAAITPAAPAVSTQARAEIARVFTHDLGKDSLPPEDLHYLGQRVAFHTGMSAAAAEQRIAASYASLVTLLRDQRVAADAQADQARRASSHIALWLFIAVLLGAFVASLAATYGGVRRDA